VPQKDGKNRKVNRRVSPKENERKKSESGTKSVAKKNSCNKRKKRFLEFHPPAKISRASVHFLLPLVLGDDVVLS
jgi:hypothetical protein